MLEKLQETKLHKRAAKKVGSATRHPESSRPAKLAAFLALMIAGQLCWPSFAHADEKSSAEPSGFNSSATLEGTSPLSISKLGTNSVKNVEELNFYALADQYLQDLFQFEPSFATQLGCHDFDRQLEDASADARLKEDQFNKTCLQKFEAVDARKFSLAAKNDLELVKNHIQSTSFESQVLQGWKRNPDSYSSFICSTLFTLIKRDFAPLDVRLKSVIEREKKMPALLANAQKNLDPKSVPKIFAELANEQLPGIIDFFRTDVPNALKAAKNERLKEEFRQSNGEVVAALIKYQQFVKDLLADKSACKGDYALGSEHFSRLLDLKEMVNEPLDSLLSRGQSELKRLQSEFHETAHSIDATSTQTELFDSISRNHPPADKLLQSTKEVLGRIRTFITDKKIVTIPGADTLLVEDTPPFMRATTFAAMEAPGPFEQKAKEAFYFVTLPERSWDKQRTEEYMRAYTFPDLLNTSIHEAYPGHYVQALWNKRLGTNVRRAFDCSSNAEGWAHYCEQMLLDQGFDSGDKQLRLIQIHDALLRCCRYIVAIKMHTQGMTVDQATAFFMNEGYQERLNAEKEAKRGTVDPTYLVYTLGKLEILALRDRVKKAQGDKFDLLAFHDGFLSIGAPPLRIVTAELLNKFGIEQASQSSVKQQR